MNKYINKDNKCIAHMIMHLTFCSPKIAAHAYVCIPCHTPFYLIGIDSMQDWTATTRHGVKRQRTTKILKHTGNLVRKNLS